MKEIDNAKTLEFRKGVWERDFGSFPDSPILKKGKWKQACVFWKIFTKEEKRLFLLIHSKTLFIAENIDVCHVITKGSNEKLRYDITNAFLGNRISHNFLDTFHDPITGKRTDKETIEKWQDRIRSHINEYSKS